MAVCEHEIATDKGGRARAPGERPEELVPEIARYLRTVDHLAAQGTLVDVGDITQFAAPSSGVLGMSGVVYCRPEPLAGVGLALSALAAIPLVAGETEAVKAFGPTRVLGRIGRHARFYSWPPWWERGRAPVGACSGDDHSILRRLPHARVAGLFLRIDGNDRLLLRCAPEAHEKLRQVLDEAPADAAFAIVTEPDPQMASMVASLGRTTRETSATGDSSWRANSACGPSLLTIT
jgi:hypothetical protein